MEKAEMDAAPAASDSFVYQRSEIWSVDEVVREIWNESPGISHRELLSKIRIRNPSAADVSVACIKAAKQALPYRYTNNNSTSSASRLPSDDCVRAIAAKLLERQRLRGLRRFADADRILDELKLLGIEVDDAHKTWSWKPASTEKDTITLDKTQAIKGGEKLDADAMNESNGSMNYEGGEGPTTNKVGKDSSAATTTHACAVCGRSFASRNQMFKHVRNSACGTAPNETMPVAPSALRKEERRAAYLQQQQQRRNNKTGATVLHTQHSLWIGDLPLVWTRKGGNYRRLRALLREYLPRDVATPWIKMVMRKAYRSKCPVAMSDQDDNETKTSAGAYVGYAIVVFRDSQECEAVQQALDGKEVTVESVFRQEWLATNQDFASMAGQKVPPFCLKVRPVENNGTGTKTESTVTSPTAGQDPPLSDQLRPLPTAVLLAREKALRSSAVQKHDDPSDNGVRTAIEKHTQALNLAISAYESAPPRSKIKHEGRIIPDDIREKLLNIIRDLRWEVPNHRVGLTAERYLVLQSNVCNDPFFQDLRDACKTLMKWADPDYYYSAVAVTKNFVGSPHIDDRDQSFQYAVSLGDFTTGGELCVDGTDREGREVLHVVNTHNRIARVDGRHVHWVRTWEGGDRYSLIFYNTSVRDQIPVLQMGVDDDM